LAAPGRARRGGGWCAPRPVDIAKVEPAGGVTDEVRKQGEANLTEHKKVKHPK